MKKIKELSLNVGTTPDLFPGNQHIIPKDYSGQMLTNADSGISRYMQRVMSPELDDELEDEEEMSDILENRVYRNNKYQLCETLDNLNESILKSLSLSIPGVDVALGTGYFLPKYATEIKIAVSSISSVIGFLSENDIENGFVGSDDEFQKLLSAIKNVDEDKRDQLKSAIDDVLMLIKKMIVTAAQSYDSVPAAIGILGSPVGLALSEGAINLLTAVGGYIVEKMPIEQFLFEFASGRNELWTKFLNLMHLLAKGSTIIPTLGFSLVVEKLLIAAISKISESGGKFFEMLIQNPVELFQRLGDIYKASKDPNDSMATDVLKYAGQRTFDDYIGNFLPGRDIEFDVDLRPGDLALENKKTDDEKYLDEELEEAITTAAMAGNPVLPLGRTTKRKADGKHVRLSEKEKALNEQREMIAMLQAYHQKTTNRLK